MPTAGYIYREEDGAWLGFLVEFPSYWTQGASLEDLQEHLLDLHKELSSGAIPYVRRRGERTLA